jgi:ABC-type ATPase involved in cell division
MASTDTQLAGAAQAGPLIEIGQVEQRYGEFRPVLLGVDLAVARGELVVIAGAGGSGKSVLLRLLSGLEMPAAGSIRIAGEDLGRMRSGVRRHLRRSIGILPPGDSLVGRRSVEENVALAAWIAGASYDEGLKRARAALQVVGIEARSAAMPAAWLSGGEGHCAALARALVNRPALLLLDDLLAPLDDAAAARILQVIEQFCAAGVTVIATACGDGPAPNRAWPARARWLRLRDGRLES